MKLARPGYLTLRLTNDLYSWRKERKAAERTGLSYVLNAIGVIMREGGVGEEAAMQICSDESRKYMSNYGGVVDKARDDPSLSRELRKYLEAVLLSCFGNLVWSIHCPR